MRSLLLLLLVFPTFYGCLQQDQDFVLDISDGTMTIKEIQLFDGAEEVYDVTDTTATVEWKNSNIIHSYIIYEASDLDNLKVLGIADSSNAVFKITKLEPNTDYKIIVRAIFSSAVSSLIEDTNENILEFTTGEAPDVPSAVSLMSPSESYGTDNRPVIRVFGTKPDDIVRIYLDDGCSEFLEETIASQTTTYTEVQLYDLELGEYAFYATLGNSQTESGCSEFSAKYEVSACPFNYVQVEENNAVGTTYNFCVAKYEMKCSDSEGVNCPEGDTPLSKPDGKPWVNVSMSKAKAACESLGPQYKLIRNKEWMAMAREAENNVFNWTDFKKVNLNQSSPSYNPKASLNRGHSNNMPSEYLAAADNDNEACFGLTDIDESKCSALIWHINKRTHNLNADRIIWDIAGNVWEWVDFESDKKPSADWSWKELEDVVFINNGPGDPSNTDIQDNGLLPSISGLNAQEHGIGVYYSSANSYKSTMRRGGNKDHGIGAGVYSAVLRESIGEASPDVGFRCVYHLVTPPPL